MDYVRVEEVLEISGRVLGSAHALRDAGLLDSAVHRPQQTIFEDDAYPTVWEKAAALMHSLARNHAFVDGNKRTALVATLLFLSRNGVNVDGQDDGQLIALVMGVAEGLTDVSGLAAQLKELFG